VTTDRPLAIVTGGGSGMGRATAAELSSDHHVVIVGRRRDVLERTAKALGDSVFPFPADASRLEDVQELVTHVLKTHGRIDLLFNGAAVRSPRLYTGMDLAESLTIWNGQLANNATSQFLMCYAVAPHLTRPGGRIINVSSHGILTGGFKPGTVAYIAAKGAVHGLTVALARELSSDGITVNALVPGFVANTDITGQLTPEQQDAYVAHTAVGRPGQPDDIAFAVRYLASPRSGYMTGQFLHLNGGAAIGR
jgi:3-oxoacyl-[acyl-carrier protein] reductase